MKSRTTKMSLAVIAALAVAAITGCDSGMSTSTNQAPAEAKDGALKIAYLQKQGDQQYFVDEADGAQEKAQELGNVEVTVVNLGTDSNKAITEVDAAVARGYDGIVLVAPDQQIGPQVANAVGNSGLLLLASDDNLKDGNGNAIPFVGFDGTDMGNKVGEEAARLYTQAGWTPENTKIISAYKQDLSVCGQRVDGALETFTSGVGAGNVPEVIELGTDNSVTDAQNKAGAALTANAGVKNWVVWGCNDENVTGVVTALQNGAVSPDNIIGVGLGANLTCKDWKAGQVTGNKAALFISGRNVGAQAIEEMVKALREGKPLPAETIADSTIVNAQNWEQAGVSCS